MPHPFRALPASPRGPGLGRALLVLAAALVPAALAADTQTRPSDKTAGKTASPDPVAALDDGWVVRVAVVTELPKADARNLAFAFDKGWEGLLDRILQRRLVRERLIPLAPGEGRDPERTRRPGDPDVHLRLVLSRAKVEAKDNSHLESMVTWVRVNARARVELLLPGEEVPRTTDVVEAVFEAEELGALSAGLYADAYQGTFEALALRAAGQAARRLRPERFQPEEDSPFAPFKPFRPR